MSWIVDGGTILELRARVSTVFERLDVALRRARAQVYDYGDEGLTIDSRPLRRCSRTLCARPDSVNMLGCWDEIRTDFSKLGTLCVIKTYRVPSHYDNSQYTAVESNMNGCGLHVLVTFSSDKPCTHSR